MTTPARVIAIPVAALVLLGACSGDDDSAGDTTTAASAASTVATTAATTAAPTTGAPTTSAGATTAPPATAGPTAPPTTDPVTGDRPVTGGSVEIIVMVGVDDAATAGGRVEPVAVGSEVELRLYSDSAEEYHIHDLDLEQAVPGGVEAVFQFVADRPGRYDVESHTSGAVLVTIEVV